MDTQKYPHLPLQLQRQLQEFRENIGLLLLETDGEGGRKYPKYPYIEHQDLYEALDVCSYMGKIRIATVWQDLEVERMYSGIQFVVAITDEPVRMGSYCVFVRSGKRRTMPLTFDQVVSDETVEEWLWQLVRYVEALQDTE